MESRPFDLVNVPRFLIKSITLLAWRLGLLVVNLRHAVEGDFLSFLLLMTDTMMTYQISGMTVEVVITEHLGIILF